MSYRAFSSKKNSRGFTLVELLLATLILVIGGVAILESFTVDAYFSAINRGRTTAMTDLSNMMEAIISTPFSDLTVRFPPNDQDGMTTPTSPINRHYVNIVSVNGVYALKNEHITVRYVNPNSDPKEITVTLNWQDGRGRTQTTALVTKRTQ